MSAEFSSYMVLRFAIPQMTTAALLELADNPTNPSDTERKKVYDALVPDDSDRVNAALIRYAARAAMISAVTLYAQLTHAVDESFANSPEEL